MKSILNIYELHQEIHKKKVSRTVTYDKVLDICHNKIKIAAKNELLRVCFDVPEFVIGLPVYDLNECIKYVMSNLNRNQFMVQYYFPKILYISWDWDEINNAKTLKITNEKPETEKSTELLPVPKRLFHTVGDQTIDGGGLLPQESDRLLIKRKLEFRPNGKFRLNLD
jgi:hypothetical protein